MTLANKCDLAFELASVELHSVEVEGFYVALCNPTSLLLLILCRNSRRTFQNI